MEKFFKLQEHHTTVGTELLAGMTTFLRCLIFYL